MIPPSTLPRRGFLGRLAAGTAALTLAALPAAAHAERTLRRPAEDPDHWLDALTGKHRQIFDVLSPDKATEGTAFARNFLNANNDGYGLADTDVNAVVSFRHASFAMGLNDAMWARYRLAELVGYGGGDGRAVTSNPLAGSPDDARTSSNTLTALHARGVVFPLCGMAMAHYAGQAARRAGAETAAVLADFRANFVPGALEAVAGVIAVNRAQEHGLSYVYVG
jgi:hypothetical protein